MPSDVETMFSVRQVPWHGLGQVLPDYPKSKEELLAAAGLDWTVDEYPVTVDLPDRKLIAPDKKALVRSTDGELLSIMGGSYCPLQPSALVDFAYALLEVDAASVRFETAMSLSGGKVNTILAKVPDNVMVGGADPIEVYIAFVNSHDGSLRFGVHVTPIRIVCRNTLNLALRNTVQSWSCKHTSGAVDAIEEARKALRLTTAYAGVFEREMNALLDQEFTKLQFERMVKELWPKPDREPAPFSREQYSMIGLLESSPTIDDGMRYTRWGALNAVTEYMGWNTRFNQGGAPVEEKRSLNVLFGDAKKQGDRAMAYLS